MLMINVFDMVFNDSHPIRATITIIWKEKYKQLKEDFENKLRSNCEIYSQENKRKEHLKLITSNTEFYDKFDIIGVLRGDTPKCSYIIKEDLDELRTSLDLFNDKEHIKSSVNFVKKLIKKTIKDSKDFKIVFPLKAYSWTEVYSLNSVIFQKQSFGSVLLENLPVLLGWTLVPAIKIGNIYFGSANNIKMNNFTLLGSIGQAFGSINKTEMLASLLFIGIIYLGISTIKWRKSKNEIRI